MRRFVGAERGAVLVEFALAMPILAILMVVIIDFSLAMFTINNLTTAVREGGRLAAAKKDLAATNDADVIARVRQQVALSLAVGGTTNYTVTSSYNSGTGLITVTIDGFTYRPLTRVVSGFRMKRQAVFRWERFTGTP